jgi:hypothetical protein
MSEKPEENGIARNDRLCRMSRSLKRISWMNVTALRIVLRDIPGDIVEIAFNKTERKHAVSLACLLV